MADLTRYKKQRGAHRSIVERKICSEIEHLKKREFNEEIRIHTSSLLGMLQEKENTIKHLDSRIENLLEDEEELTADMDKAHDFNINIKKSKEILTTLLYKNDEDKLSAVSTISKNTGVKLPKLNLKRFTGEPLEWKSFMETFDAAVNSRT